MFEVKGMTKPVTWVGNGMDYRCNFLKPVLVHSMVHQLRLVLIVATREVLEVHISFQKLILIINIVISSSKHYGELEAN